MSTLLTVNDCNLSLIDKKATYPILNQIGFSVQAGETLALVGESGCGKSLTSLMITKLLPSNIFSYDSGEVDFLGRNLWSLAPKDLRMIRGQEIAYVFQEPFSAFDPLQKVGKQMIEAPLVHSLSNEHQARQKALSLLEKVGITDPEMRFDSYPGQLSGGMLQRASIAMSLMCDPKLLIADEPTSAIDVTIQVQLVDLIQRIQKENKMGIIFISHDIGLVSHLADQMGVMYAGRIVEIGNSDSILDSPTHPYTQGLLSSYPGNQKRGNKLETIEGQVPQFKDYGNGCRFLNRCRKSQNDCKSWLPISKKSQNGQKVECLIAR